MSMFDPFHTMREAQREMEAAYRALVDAQRKYDAETSVQGQVQYHLWSEAQRAASEEPTEDVEYYDQFREIDPLALPPPE